MITKTLCLDFGNTRLKAALFHGAELAATFVLEGNGMASLQTLIEEHKPHHCILSSVINHAPEAETLLQQHTRFHKLTAASKLPFTVPVSKPESMGADRLAIAAAATFLFPRQNNLAIGLGTCITYNFISQQHSFLGGSISPGMEMRFEAMHRFTAKLPLQKGHWNVPLTGYDTATNLQSGVVLGMACEIDGLINLYRKKWGNFNALLTGGDTALFSPCLKNKIFADPHLIFKGLYAISQNNLAE